MEVCCDRQVRHTLLCLLVTSVHVHSSMTPGYMYTCRCLLVTSVHVHSSVSPGYIPTCTCHLVAGPLPKIDGLKLPDIPDDKILIHKDIENVPNEYIVMLHTKHDCECHMIIT